MKKSLLLSMVTAGAALFAAPGAQAALTDYTTSPASGTVLTELPTEDVEIKFSFRYADYITCEEYEVPGSDDWAVARVTYADESIPRREEDGWWAYSDDDNYFKIVVKKDWFTGPGTLNIHLDQNYFTIDGNTGTPEINYTLTYQTSTVIDPGKEFTYTLAPDDETLSKFTLTFDNAETATFNEGSSIILAGPLSYTQYEMTQVEGAEHPTFNFTFDPSPEMEGTYSVTVEEGAFTLDGMYKSPKASGSYFYKRTTPIDMSCTASPEGNKVLANSYGTYLAFVFAELEEVTAIGDWRSKVHVTFEGQTLTAGTDYTLKLAGGEAGDSYKVTIDIEGSSPYVGKTGTYTATIDADALSISGEPFQGITHKWTAVTPQQYPLLCVPAEGSSVTSLAEITIYTKGASQMELYKETFVALRRADYSGYYANPSDYYSTTVDGKPAVKLIFDPAPTALGEYVLALDYSAFSIDQVQASDAKNISFNLIEAPAAIEYKTSPESGSVIKEMPTEDVSIRFTFPRADYITLDEFEDPTSDDWALARVTYGPTGNLDRDVSIPRRQEDGWWAYTDDDNYFTIVIKKEWFTQPGTLHIQLDKNYFTIDGKMGTPAIDYTLTYDIATGPVKDYTCEITKDDDTLSSFTIAFTNASSATFNEGSYIVMRGPRTLTQYDITAVEGAACPTFKLTFDPAPYQHGWYTLEIEEGSFLLDGADKSQQLMRTYYLERTTPIDFTCTPSPDGAKALAFDYGTYLAFVFADDETVSPMAENWQDLITLTFDGETLVQGKDYVLKLQDDDISYKITFDIESPSKYVGKTGTYTATIAPNTLSISGEPFPGTTHTWTTVKPGNFPLSFLPAEGSTTYSLAEITVYAEDAEEFELYKDTFIALRAADYFGYYSLPTGSEQTTVDGKPAVKLFFDPAPTAPGEYVLALDYSAFTINKVQSSDAKNVTFTLSDGDGIADVDADMAAGARFFNLQGVEVANPEAGRVYIRVAGTEATKVLVK